MMLTLHHNVTAENIMSYLSNKFLHNPNSHIHELDSTAAIDYNVVKYMHI